jgi:hypothetical protein
MARNFSLEVLESFSGGLNLRSDQFNLADAESPDLLNVSVDPRGGIRMRDGVDRRNVNPLVADVKGMWGFHRDSTVSHLMANYGTKVGFSVTNEFTDITGITDRTAGSRVYGITMNNVAYGVSYDKPSFRWDGSTGSDLGANLGAAGNMPKAQYITFWNNFAWIAHTNESGRQGSRLRWSKINDPEYWSAEDFVDIDLGEHGDYITALVPAGDRLLVFKTNSVYAVYGFDSDSFQVVTLSNSMGSVPLSSPVNTSYGTFFWHAQNGVYVYDGNQFVYLFSRIDPAISNENITFGENPQLAWGNNKLYVSVDWSDKGTVVRRTLVYDPTLGQGGAWTMTDIDAGPLFSFRPPNQTPTVFAGCVANTGCVIDVEDEQKRDSDRYTGNTSVHIDSYFVTRWVTGKDPIVRKRWGRPRVVVSAEETLTLPVQIFKDYDKSTQTTTFSISVTGKTSGSRWGIAKWDDSTEGSPTIAKWDAIQRNLTAEVETLPTLGTGRSVSMKISGPTGNLHWEINALAFTYNPRRLR